MKSNYYDNDEDKKRKDELVRFYQQKRSTMIECNWGNKNCDDCEQLEGCKIAPFIPR